MNRLFQPPVTSKKVLIWVLMVLILALLIFAVRILYVGFVNPVAAFETTVQQPLPSPTPVPTQELLADGDSTEPPPPTEEEILLSQADLNFIRNKVNILLIGADISQERLSSKRLDYRSDVLLLLTIDFDGQTASLISIPRDSYAPIYNTKGRWKINAAFAHGGGYYEQGPEYAMQTIGNLLGGIPINYYVGVDMNALKAAVDALGGIDYDVDIEIKLNGRVLKKGMQHLDGQQVLDYCRARKGISTDIGRTDRQQRILMTVFDQLKQKDQLLNIPKVYQSMSDKIFTNLTFEQLVALAVFAKDMDLANVSRATLEGKYLNVYDASFYVLDMVKKEELIKRVFGIDINSDYTYDVTFVEADSNLEKQIKAATSLMEKSPEMLDYSQFAALEEMVANAKMLKSGTDIEAKNEYALQMESYIAGVGNYYYSDHTVEED